MSHSSTGQQGDPQRAPRVIRQMVVTMVQQSSRIDPAQFDQLERTFETVRDQIVAASGRPARELQEQQHDIVLSAQHGSQLSPQLQAWASETLFALDDQTAKDDPQFQATCAEQIAPLAKATAQAGLEAPAEARQYATQGRQGGQEGSGSPSSSARAMRAVSE